jgi:hypothetical protein
MDHKLKETVSFKDHQKQVLRLTRVGSEQGWTVPDPPVRTATGWDSVTFLGRNILLRAANSWDRLEVWLGDLGLTSAGLPSYDIIRIDKQ